VSRLPYVTEGELTEPQRAVWDTLLGGRRGSAARLVNDEGGLIGPFNAMVTAPVVGGPMATLGEAIRFDTSLDRRLQELAIIIVGAHFRANFEFWAHGRMAVAAGLPQSVVDSLAAGEAPTFEQDDEALVHRFTTSLVGTGRVDDSTYRSAHELLGSEQLVEMVATIGYYALVSLTLDAFAVALPPGNEAPWPD
jgi:4-carboxymuconolactone decarboxylase